MSSSQSSDSGRPVLVVDSSLKGVSVGLFCGPDQKLQTRNCHETYGSSQFLPVGVQECLASEGLSLGDLSGLVVANGPGSFTGIKIGLSFCQGLLQGQGASEPIACLGLSSMEAYQSINPSFSSIALPATKTQGYVFTRVNGEFEHLVVKKQGDDYELGNTQGNVELERGSTINLMLPWEDFSGWASSKGYKVSIPEYSDVARQTLEGLVKLSLEKFSRGDHRESGASLEPFYLRKSAAEERLDEKS